MTNYHISGGQTKVCTATVRTCPIGGDHYSTLHEANETLLQQRVEEKKTHDKITLLVKNGYFYSEEEKTILRKQIRDSMKTNPLPNRLPKGIDIADFEAMMKQPMSITAPDQSLIQKALDKGRITKTQLVQAIQSFDYDGAFALLRGAHITRRVVAYARMNLLDRVIAHYKRSRAQTASQQTQGVQQQQSPTLSQQAKHYAGQYAKNSLRRGAIRVGRKAWVNFNNFTTVRL